VSLLACPPLTTFRCTFSPHHHTHARTNASLCPACGDLTISSDSLPIVDLFYATPAGIPILVNTTGDATSTQMFITVTAPAGSTFSLAAASVTAGDNSALLPSIRTPVMTFQGFDATGASPPPINAALPAADPLATTDLSMESSVASLPAAGIQRIFIAEKGAKRRGFVYTITISLDPCVYAQ
jgi:hypothetical protein